MNPPLLSEHHYGEHWHNASVIIVAVFSTWFITGVLRGGFSWCIIVLAFCGGWPVQLVALPSHLLKTEAPLLTEVSADLILNDVASYYRRSIRRTHRNMEDDIRRASAVTRLETDEETVEWLNAFLSRFWIIYEPVLSSTIVGIVDPILAVSTPSFLDSISLTTFTLGTKSPRVESVRSYLRTEQDVVVRPCQ